MSDLGPLLDRRAADVRAGPDALSNVLRRVEGRRRRRRAGTVAMALFLTAAGTATVIVAFRMGAGSRPAAESTYRGVECLSEDEPGLITCHEAIDRASFESGSAEERGASSADAELVRYPIRPGEEPTRVWAVTYHDVITPIFGPPGRPGPDCGVGDWTIAINARTGEYISEGGSSMATPCPPRRPEGWTRFEITRFDSSIGVPPGWSVQEFDEDIAGRFSFAGVVLTNVDFTFEHPDLGPGRHTSAWDMHELPSNAVVVMFSHGVSLAFCTPNSPDTKFPLRFDDLRPVDPPALEDTYGEPQPRLHRSVSVGGDPHYQLDVWFAPDASSTDRALAEDIVGSIEEPDPLTCESGTGPAESPKPSPAAG